jgi:hypothetical protein
MPCPPCCSVLYKLSREGSCEEVAAENLVRVSGLPLAGFTPDMFLQMCILAGCDFCAGLPGIGLKKAHAALRKYRSFSKVGGRCVCGGGGGVSGSGAGLGGGGGGGGASKLQGDGS